MSTFGRDVYYADLWRMYKDQLDPMFDRFEKGHPIRFDMYHTMYNFVQNSVQISTWEETHNELLKTYGGVGTFEEMDGPEFASCNHVYSPLFSSNEGFCKKCDRDGFINNEGRVQWK